MTLFDGYKWYHSLWDDFLYCALYIPPVLLGIGIGWIIWGVTL